MKHNLLRNTTFILLAIGLFSCKKNNDEPAPAATVTTLAGNGIEGWADGNAATAQFNRPIKIAVDGQGNIFISDRKKYCIRRIAPDGTVTTIAGGSQGTADGTGASAQFMIPGSIVADKQGNLYVGDGSRVRKITPDGTVTTLAGSSTAGSTDGTGTAAQFRSVGSMAMNSVGVLYVVDHDIPDIRPKIRKISPSSEVTTFIDSTILFGITEIVVNRDDNLLAVFLSFFSDATIRKIAPSKNITQFAKIPSPDGMAIGPHDELYFTATTNERNTNFCKVYKVGSNSKYVPIAGGELGFADGDGAAAKFLLPNGLAVDAGGKIYVADTDNNRIRKITMH